MNFVRTYKIDPSLKMSRLRLITEFKLDFDLSCARPYIFTLIHFYVYARTIFDVLKTIDRNVFFFFLVQSIVVHIWFRLHI